VKAPGPGLSAVPFFIRPGLILTGDEGTEPSGRHTGYAESPRPGTWQVTVHTSRNVTSRLRTAAGVVQIVDQRAPQIEDAVLAVAKRTRNG
jgi:hypothetical protein